MQVYAAVQAEINTIAAARKIINTLTRSTPPATNRVFIIREEVSVYTENDKIGLELYLLSISYEEWLLFKYLTRLGTKFSFLSKSNATIAT